MTNVYIFDFGNRIKIGKSNRVPQRLKAIENHSGEKVKQVFFVETDINKERILHDYLQEYRTVGEYFTCSFDTAKSAFHDILDGKIKLERNVKEIINESKQGKKIQIKGKSSISNKIKELLNYEQKTYSDIAAALKISEAAVSNKFYRDSFSAEDLIKIANCLGFNLALINDSQKVIFDISDIDKNQNE